MNKDILKWIRNERQNRLECGKQENALKASIHYLSNKALLSENYLSAHQENRRQSPATISNTSTYT